MNYLERCKVIASEVRKEHRGGLLFERNNIIEKNESRVSSIGSYFSNSLGREVFVGLEEFRRSSATLRTAFNIGFAESENSMYRKQVGRSEHVDDIFAPILSSFYSLLLDRDLNEVGMLFEDFSRGGSHQIIETIKDKEEDEDFLQSINVDKLDPDSVFTFTYKVPVGVHVDGAVKIVDFSPLISSVVLNEGTAALKLNEIVQNQKLPTVTLRRVIR